MLGEIAIKIALQETIRTCAKYLKEHRLRIDTSWQEIESAIAKNSLQTNNWSKEISFSDLKKAKLTSQVFIDIDILLMPKKSRISVLESVEKISCKDIFKEIDKHLVILGQPGAGKTTLMKFLCQSIMLNEYFYPDLFKIPIIIRLRELNSKVNDGNDKSPIINTLFEILGLVLNKEDADKKISDEDILLAKERVLFPLMEKLLPLIILDGYDEISTPRLREKIIDDFRRLCLNLNSAKVVLTSRSSDYGFSIENTAVLEICPLSDEQIESFSLKWLGDKEKSDDFVKNLNDSPFVDTVIRPLTLSHLCAIYERVGKIPDKPKTVYKKIVNLLLEEWDEQRSVKRVSSYGNFEVDRKFDFLCRLAFEITTQSKQSVFNETILKSIYSQISPDFGLSKNEADKVIKELEGHTGLIIQSGYKEYEFAHKSIHEYLCAEHLVKLPVIPKSDGILFLLPNELAIATTISSDPSNYFCELVLNRFYPKSFGFRRPSYNANFMASFVNRIVLEKPDFNLSKDISFALVVLYTLFRRTDTGQLQLFDYELPIQFEKFVEIIFKRNRKFEFKKYYDLDEKYRSEQADPILKLKRNNIVDRHSNEYNLPEYLFAKRSFVSGFEKP